jgi:hypothetical protein
LVNFTSGNKDVFITAAADRFLQSDASNNYGNFTAGTIVAALTGNASTATTLATARTIGLSGVTATATSFNGGSNIVIPITAVPTTLLTGAIPDANISGSYTGMVNLTGSGSVDFNKFLGLATDLVSTPSYTWTGDTTTGLYRPNTGQIGVTIAGVQRGLFTSTGLAVTGSIGATNLSGTNTGDSAVNTLYSSLVTNATHTGDVTGATALTIANNSVNNVKLADMATATLKGRVTAATGDPEDLTVAQARTLLAVNNVDNTTDLSKPVSTDTQTALATKENNAPVGRFVFSASSLPLANHLLCTGQSLLKTDFPTLVPFFPDSFLLENHSVGSAIHRGMAWNGTVFCTVTTAAIAKTSTDGVTWTNRSLPVSQSWASIAWSNSLFVAVGTNSLTAATSPDGITWTSRTMPSASGWTRLAWNGTVFLAVSNSNAAATSPDGITWTGRTIPISSASAVAWNGSVFCVVTSSGSTAAISSDGITWSTVDLPPGVFITVAGNSGVLCIVAQNSIFSYRSTDNGASWVLFPVPVQGNWTSLVWASGYFWLAGQGSPVFLRSIDAINWERISVLSATWGTNTIAANEQFLVMVSTNGSQAIKLIFEPLRIRMPADLVDGAHTFVKVS